MKITRNGAKRRSTGVVIARDFGTVTSFPPIRWSSDGTVWISSREQPSVDQSGVTYNYVIELSLRDISEILDVIATSGIEKSASEIHRAFKHRLVSMVRLAACAGGSNPTPLVE